jgi:ABC-2 type transport system ATP-binding protein
MGSAIVVEDLRKRYGRQEALRGVSFAVAPGEVVAVLGPNGAGKTTAIEILEGHRQRSAGRAEVLGLDPATRARALRERTGVVLQSTSIDPELTVAEVVALYAGFYPRPRAVDEVVELVGLAGQRDTRVAALSGGQQRRVDLALGVVGDPDLLFLDEPTTGFDPAARRQAWELVRGLAGLGKTILLTSHYLDEAQALADRVLVLAGGRLVAEGEPASLGGRDHGLATIGFRLPAAVPAADLPAAVGAGASLDGREVRLRTDHPTLVLGELVDWARRRGEELDGLVVTRPTLEDVYLELIAEQEHAHA